MALHAWSPPARIQSLHIVLEALGPGKVLPWLAQAADASRNREIWPLAEISCALRLPCMCNGSLTLINEHGVRRGQAVVGRRTGDVKQTLGSWRTRIGDFQWHSSRTIIR